jgi:ATP-binding cassette, subfamily B, bacterial
MSASFRNVGLRFRYGRPVQNGIRSGGGIRSIWFRRLAGYILRRRRSVLLCLAAAVGSAVVNAVNPLFTGQIIDGAVAGHAHSATLWGCLLLVSAIVGYGLAWVRRFFGSRIAHDVHHDLRVDMFRALMSLDGPRRSDVDAGEIVGRTTADLQLIQPLLYVLPVQCENLLLFVVSLVAMVWLSLPLTCVVSLVVPVVWWLARRSRRRLVPATERAQARIADVTGVVNSVVAGVREVKGFGQEQREVARLARVGRALLAARLRTSRLSALYDALLQAVPSLGQIGVLALGGWFAARGVIGIGTYVAFAMYLAQLVGPVRILTVTLTISQQARAGAERVFRLVDTKPTMVAGAGQLPAGKPVAVEFDHVHFGYQAGQPVVDDVCLTIEPGETVAVMGSSGSGKSTLVRLLLRLHDVTGGAVRVGGQDVRDLTFESLRTNVAVVPQDTFLFAGTVGENIAYGRVDTTDDEIVTAAKAARAHDFIVTLPDGYRTVVGERGMTLSGGQRQRIALARALAVRPGLLILDDPTSAVDAVVESDIHDALRAVTADCTTLIVVRSRTSLVLADRIAVLDGGRIADVGTHDELWLRCPRFRELLAGSVRQETTTALDPSPASVVAPAAVPSPERSPAHGEPTGFAARRLVRGFEGILLASLLLVVIDTVAGLVLPVLARHGVDVGVRQHVLSVLWMVSAIGLGVVAVQCAAQWWADRLAGQAGEHGVYRLRIRSFDHLNQLGLDYFERVLSGHILTTMTADVDALSSFLQNGLIAAVVSFLTFLGILIALAAINLTLAVLVYAALPPILVATWFFRRRATEIYGLARREIGAVNSSLHEHVAGLEVVQSFHAEQRGIREYTERSDSYRTVRIRGQRMLATYFPFIEALSTVVIALVLVRGAGMVANGTLMVGTLVAYLLFIDLLFAPLQQVSRIFDGYQQAKVSSARIAELLATPASVVSAQAPRGVIALTGEITFDGVSFDYGGNGPDVLTGIDLHITPGQTVVFVGETGAGKSTLVKLAARFYDPTSGAVLVDGHDLRELDLTAYRRRLGTVPQDPYLFAGTVRDAIGYGRPDATDANVEAAARAVGAHDMIMSLAGGYQHIVGERGHRLSTGQRQLVALARAFLVDPDILLLDESTAALDPETEELVARAVDVAARRRTTLIVAHQLTTAARADRIVVLHRGRIAEHGTHGELLAAGGRYAALWHTRMAGEITAA